MAMEDKAKEAEEKIKRLNAQGCAMMGLLYGVVAGFLGAAMAGAGHGTAFFIGLVASPFPWGFIFWPIIGALSPFFDRKVFKVFAWVLLLLHYLGILHFCYENGIPNDVKKVWDVLPGWVTSFCVFYFSGQIWIWWQLLKKRTELV